MLLMSNSATFGADVRKMSGENYEESSETYELIFNWKNRGYSTILDVMMVIINHDVHDVKYYNKYFILF